MSQEQRTAQRSGDWLAPHVSEEDAAYILDHMEDLEPTQVPYLWPLLLGMVAGVLLVLGLLFASL